MHNSNLAGECVVIPPCCLAGACASSVRARSASLLSDTTRASRRPIRLLATLGHPGEGTDRSLPPRLWSYACWVFKVRLQLSHSGGWV